MDEVIFEEFKGHRQFGAHPRPQVADKRTFPAIDITRSRHPQGRAAHRAGVLKKMYVLRRILKSDGHHGSHRLPARQAAQHQEQQRVFESMNT